MSVKITTATFKNEVLESGIPVLVDFWSERCMPCKMLAPILEELEADFGGKLKVAKVDVDANMPLAVQYDISSIPALFLFRGGEIADTVIGYRTKEFLAEFVAPYVNE